MRRLTFVAGLLAAIVPCVAAGQETCLLVSAENIVQGPGNWFMYVQISDRPYTFQAGDCLEYDIYLPSLNPSLHGGVDADLKGEHLCAELAGHPWLRDCGIKDQNGILLHGDGTLTPAKDQWYHRKFDLGPVVGCSTARWTVVFEGDEPGRYVQLLANIRVTHDGKTVFAVYENGPAPEFKLRQNAGYSRDVLVTTAPREGTLDNQAVSKILARARVENEVRRARDQFHAEVDVSRKLAGVLKNDPQSPEWLAHLDKAVSLEEAAETVPTGYLEALKPVQNEMKYLEPLTRQFTGHLVGHAHIDLQWLWGWEETVNQIIPQTFGQALKFMQEFPGFTFSQSSAALYLATEEHHPELFQQIQEFARQGQWEPVGGRWCEGDLNMISPESHVRHFLYGQRYFQEKLGRLCTDGFEPDTFGHPWTMPQILRQAGIRSYYFCRGGSGRPGHKGGPPLFWWEGPDGSKVLAFDEAALDSWYIGSVTDDKVRKLADFAEKTGAKDYLMVYGVGNHGGGPTRENIEAAIKMRDRQPWPQIKFSTLGTFFDRLYEQVDQLKIPTVREELNPVFEGCYTSHSRIKKYNRDSEVLLTSAETWAALASSGTTAMSGVTKERRGGGVGGRKLGQTKSYAYPRAELQILWRDLLWNHHHDTICGSFVHPSSEYSAKMYEALLKRGADLRRESQEQLAEAYGVRGLHIVVFNPLAWPRSEVVEISPAPFGSLTPVSDGDGVVPWQLVRGHGGEPDKLCFLARDVPGCGFKAFSIGSAKPRADAPPHGGRVEPGWPGPLLHEKPRGMSAWEIGEIDQTKDLAPREYDEFEEDGPVRRRARTVYTCDKSTITQDAITYPNTSRIDYETTVEWNQVGNPQYGGDMLKVAFATGISTDTATYEIPFGDVTRPNDGHEDAALKWCDVSSPERGVTVLNDCKHAYDVKDGVIRLTLLRSSYDPDPKPDIGTHQMRYAVLPHEGPLDKAVAVRAAWEFNRPLETLLVERSTERNYSPLGAWSACEAAPANIIVTCLKLAEDSDDFILRAYECAGQPTTATFTLGFEVKSSTDTDFLERATPQAGRVTVADKKLTADFKPYEIRTFRLAR
jgi:alpha-mannosidase